MSTPSSSVCSPSSSALSRRSLLTAAAGGAVLGAVPGLSLAQSKMPASIRYALIGEGKAEPGTVLRYGIGGMNPSRDLGGAKIDWRPGFPATLPIIEAIRGGAIDFSFATSTAMIYAVGGKVPVVPLGVYPLPSDTCYLLVHADSGIKTVQDLKGKRVADHRGTTGTYALVRTLEAAGMKLSDIQYVNLAAPDAEAAFANKRIDAWMSWQPTMELARRRYNATMLAGVKTYDYGFFVAREQFAKDHPEAVAILLRNVRDAQRQLEAKPEEVVGQFQKLGGFGNNPMEHDVYLYLAKNRLLSYSGAGDLKPVDENTANEVQRLADSFHELKIYPEKIKIKEWLMTATPSNVRDAVAAELRRSA